MENIQFASVTEDLLSAVPEFQERYDRELSWWQGPELPRQYVVFGFVVQPAVRELLVSDREPVLLKRIFDFFELMARSSDVQVPNLLGIEIFEWLVGDPESLATAWKYMGDETKRIARTTARIFRREQNVPRPDGISHRLLSNRITPNTFGILGIILFFVFWLVATTPNLVQPGSYFVTLIAAAAITALGGSFVAGLIAGICGSKWWLLSLLGPALGLMLLWSGRT
jgi:hypothetical protein